MLANLPSGYKCNGEGSLFCPVTGRSADNPMTTHRQYGFTLTEILVTIAILAIVATLLSVPLMSAFKYIQKATAITEAKRSGVLAIEQMKTDLGNAMYVFDLPPDGSYVTCLLDTGDTTNAYGSATVSLIRYSHILDFPWTWQSNKWQLLNPDYLGRPAYHDFWAPFHLAAKTGMPPNPYLITRYAEEMPWSDAVTDFGPGTLPPCLDGKYPFNNVKSGVPALLNLQNNKPQIQRIFRNLYINVTPLGQEYDVPRFVVTPVKQSAEALAPLTDSGGNIVPTVYLSRYPLWAARNRLIDDFVETGQSGWYGMSSANVSVQTIYGIDPLNTLDMTNFGAAISAAYPLYPLGTNPFGFKVQVYDATGNLRVGTVVDSTTNKYDLRHDRHYMDWPPMERQDFLTETPAGSGHYVLDTAKLLWTKSDIDQQRKEGKLVFAQPYAVTASNPQSLSFTSTGVTGVFNTTLPAPSGGGWISEQIYLVTPPQTIVLQKSSGATTFQLAATTDPTKLNPGEYCLLHKGKYDHTSRDIAVRVPAGEAFAGSWPIDTTTSLQYTIGDLLPDDTVVATYSTRGALDVALTVSRQDRTGGVPEKTRQDFEVTVRIEAKYAIKRARGN